MVVDAGIGVCMVGVFNLVLLFLFEFVLRVLAVNLVVF